MNNFFESALNELVYTEKNIETMQKNLRFLRQYTKSSIKDVAAIMVKSNGEPLTTSTYTKFEMEEGQKGRIKLSVQNTINLYEYFYKIAYENFKKKHYYLINFLASAFFFETKTEEYLIKDEDIQKSLLKYFFSLTHEEADKKIIFPYMDISEKNKGEWKIPTYKKNLEKPIRIWGTYEWEVPGNDVISLITKGEELRHLLSEYFKPITKLSKVPPKKLASVLGIATSGLKYYESDNFKNEISLAQAIELLKILPKKEDIISIIQILLIFTNTKFDNDTYNIFKKNIFDYSEAKNKLSEESVNVLYKYLIKSQIFYLETQLSNFVTIPIEKTITIEYLLSDESLEKYNSFTKDELINILRYGHK